MKQEKIDIVVLWVDGSDPEFISEKQAVTGKVLLQIRILMAIKDTVITGPCIFGFV